MLSPNNQCILGAEVFIWEVIKLKRGIQGRLWLVKLQEDTMGFSALVCLGLVRMQAERGHFQGRRSPPWIPTSWHLFLKF